MRAAGTAIYGALAGGTALVASLGGSAIYNTAAPRGSAYPIVVYNLAAGGDENLTPRRGKSLVYSVKAVSDISMNTATLLDEQIDALLHGATLTVSGWSNYWLARQSDFSYVEVTPEGRELYHAGGQYRVRLSKA